MLRQSQSQWPLSLRQPKRLHLRAYLVLFDPVAQPRRRHQPLPWRLSLHLLWRRRHLLRLHPQHPWPSQSPLQFPRYLLQPPRLLLQLEPQHLTKQPIPRLPLHLLPPQRRSLRPHRLQPRCAVSQGSRSHHPRVLGDAFLHPRAAGAMQAAVLPVERAAARQVALALEAQAPRVDIEVDQVLQQVLLVVGPEALVQGAVLQVAVLQVAVPVGPVVLQDVEVDAQVVVPVVDQGRGLVVRSVVVAA